MACQWALSHEQPTRPKIKPSSTVICKHGCVHLLTGEWRFRCARQIPQLYHLGPYYMPLLTWASYHICKSADCACTGNAGNCFPRHRLQRKPLVSDTGMHPGKFATARVLMHVGIANPRWQEKPAFPAHGQRAILRIWLEAHATVQSWNMWYFNHLKYIWWRHQMETFSVLLDICAGNSPVAGEFPAQRPVTWSFNIIIGLSLD